MTISNANFAFSLLPALAIQPISAVRPIQVDRCPRCNHPLTAGQEPDTCNVCMRAEAEAEIWRVMGTVRDIDAGAGIFSVLTADERRSHIRHIASACFPVGGLGNGGRRITPIAEMMGRTIERTAELAKSIGTKVDTSRTVSPMIKCDLGPAPTPEEREEIEERIHWMEEPERWDGLG